MALLKRIKLMLRHQKKQGYRPKESLVALKTRYFLEIKNIEASLKFDSPSVASLRLFSLVKDFFSELLGERGSLTLQEIEAHFKYKHFEPEVKQMARDLLENITQVEYGGGQIKEKDIKTLLEDFKLVVEKI